MSELYIDLTAGALLRVAIICRCWSDLSNVSSIGALYISPPETIRRNDNEASVVAEIHARGHWIIYNVHEPSLRRIPRVKVVLCAYNEH